MLESTYYLSCHNGTEVVAVVAAVKLILFSYSLSSNSTVRMLFAGKSLYQPYIITLLLVAAFSPQA